MPENKSIDIGTLLLEVGALLMSSGANTNRIRLTMGRIAKSYGYKPEFLITHRAIMLTLQDKQGNHYFNQVKQTYAQVPNFRMVSGISKLSWRIADDKLSPVIAWTEIERLKSLSRYHRFITLTTVALACASFCRLGGGHFIEMVIVFMSSLFGLFIKQELSKKNVNIYLTVFFASFLTSMLCGGFGFWQDYEHDNITFVTSILYLIPGIPLINCVSDIMDGYSLNGIVRAMNGFVTSFAIASGLLIAILIYDLV